MASGLMSRRRSSPRATFSKIVSESNSAENWNTKPIVARSAVSAGRRSSDTTCPSTATCPASGSSSPTTCLMATLLPVPE